MPPTSTNPTLSDAILYTLCTRPSWSEGASGHRTAACNARHLVSHLGGDTRLGDITPARVAVLRTALAADGRSPATVNRVLSVLSTVLRHCHQDGLLDGAPIPIRREKESEGRLTWFTKEQVHELCLLAIDRCDEGLASLINFAAYTGLRRGEIWRLRQKDINWEAGHITVGGDAATVTKNRSVRIVPLCSLSRKALRYIWEPCPKPDCSLDVSSMAPWAELFPNVDVAMRRFNAIRRAAGLPDDLVFHSLRHSFGTWHAEAGTPIRTLMALMGHKDIKTTLRYAKVTDQSLFTAMEALEK